MNTTYIPEVQVLLCTTFLYMVNDYMYHSLAMDMCVHHITVCLSALMLLYSQYTQPFVLLVWLNEVSTVFLNLMFFTTGTTKLYMRVGFVSTFFVFRIIVNTYVLCMMYLCGMYSTVVFTFLLVHYAVNVYWFVVILQKMAYYSYTPLLETGEQR